MSNIVEFDQIVEKVNAEFLKGQAYSEHRHKGTLDQYYRDILTGVASDMVVMSAQREIEGLGPLQDINDTIYTMQRIADIISMVFGKSIFQVQEDLAQTIELFPSMDVRKATILRHKNLLH